MIRKESVIAVLGSPIAYYVTFAQACGDVLAGIFVSQFFYWYGKGHDPEGWIYKTQTDIEEETGLTRRNQETARKRLRQLGVLEEKRIGMPAKLYYRLDLDRLFELVNIQCMREPISSDTSKTAADDPEEDEPDAVLAKQTGPKKVPTSRKTVPLPAQKDRMAESAIQGCTDPPTRMAEPANQECTDPPISMAEPANQECTDPPDMFGGSRQTTLYITKTTTETTTETTPQITTTGTPRPDETRQTPFPPDPVAVVVDDLEDQIPAWVLESFQELLGAERTVNAADRAALADLGTYPDHVVEDSFAAARAWLQDPDRDPIRALARWLVGTAERKQQAERRHGNGMGPAPPASTLIDRMLYLPADQERPPERPEGRTWKRVLADLALRLPSATYDTWVHDTWLLSAEGEEYVVGVPTPYVRDWLMHHLAEMIQHALADHVGHLVTVRFEVAPAPLH